MKLHWKIGGAMAIIAALVSAAGGVAAYRSTDSELNENIDRSLLDSAQRVVGRAIDRDHDESDEGHHDDREEDDDDTGDDTGDDDDNDSNVVTPPIRQSDVCPLALLQPVDAAQLIYPDGTFEPCFTDSPVLPIDDDDLEQAAGDDGDGDIDSVHLHTASVDGNDYRVITIPWGSNGALQAARDLDDVSEVLSGMRWRLILGGLAATILALVIGWFVAARISRPIRRLSEVAGQVSDTRDLTIPVPVSGSGEVADLGRSFSSMMVALSTSLDQQQRLISDASHELRTPLTALRTNVEALEMFDAIPDDERRAMLADIRTEVEELSHLTAELVDLATDQNPINEPITTVDLVAVAREVAQRATRRSGREITVTDLGGNAIDGRIGSLQRAVSNLVENAIKYSPEGSSVQVDVDGGSIRVRDHGPGIAESDQPHVFDRFYRAVESRGLPGSGLGLAIVAKAAKEHGGTTFVANAPDGGAIVGFDIPTP
jgi:two-component system sensor histidine kinase MprB